MEHELTVWGKLADIAITFGVMSLVCYVLWHRNMELERKNVELIEKSHQKDLENIRTLEMIAKTIEKLEHNDNVNTESVKRHISERINEIREELRAYRAATKGGS
jgi:hypothetical protein